MSSDHWKSESFSPTHSIDTNASTHVETTYDKEFLHSEFGLDDYDDDDDEYDGDDEFYTPNLDLPQMDVLPFDDKPFKPDPSPTLKDRKRDREGAYSRDRDVTSRDEKERRRKKKRKKKKNRDRDRDSTMIPTIGYVFPDVDLTPSRPNRRKTGKNIEPCFTPLIKM